MVTIFTTDGKTRFSTPINIGSRRVFALMGDDYITLKFTLATPLYFALGDYCDLPGHGRFELTSPYQPDYDKATAGYNYELRLDAQHIKWQNKILRYLPQVGGKEVTFALTAGPDVHLGIVLDNVNALARGTNPDGSTYLHSHFLHNGQNLWRMEIDTSVSVAAKTISYDQTNILDALTQIAEEWECEWWIDGNVIHLGKCETGGDYIDLELGDNVAEMSRSDSKEDYVTRILPFGSERNISQRYRKDLIFDVKDITDGGNKISDTARILQPNWFDTYDPHDDSGTITDLTITTIAADGSTALTIHGCTFNAAGSEDRGEINSFRLPNGVFLTLGTRFRVSNLIETKVKSSYFSERYCAYDNIGDVVKNGVVTRRLMMPEAYGKPYIDLHDGLSEEEAVEDVVIFEDIYPRAICTVTKVEEVQRKDTADNDDGTKSETTFTAFRIKDDFFTKEHPFHMDYIVPQQTLKVTFQDGKRYTEDDALPEGKRIGELINPVSGKLNGWTFEVKFTREEDGSAIWELVRDNTAFVPNDVLRPEPGDQFVLTGVDISIVNELYVAEAEKELLEKARKYLEKLNTDPSTYEVTMMPDVMKAGLTLGLGRRVNLINDALLPPTIDEEGRKWGRKSRVIGFEFPLDFPWDNPKYTIGEQPSYSRLGEISDRLDALNYAMGSGMYSQPSASVSGGTGPYVIGLADSTAASETNVFSALRSGVEFASKKIAETIDWLWTFAKGLRVGRYVPLADGAKIDPSGDAEFESVEVRGSQRVKGDASVGGELTLADSLTLGDFKAGVSGGRMWIDSLGKVHLESDYLEAREKLQAREVEIQEQTHVGGCQIISPAAMRCSRVAAMPDSFICFFNAEREDGTVIHNQFAEGDLAKCQTFNVEKQADGKAGNHFFWRKVLAVGQSESEEYGREGYIVLSNREGEYAEGSDAPQVGDMIVTVGNCDPAKPERSNLIILSSTGSGSPYIYQYKSITTFALTTANLKTAISPDGNKFTGEFLIDTGKEEIELADYIGEQTEARFEVTDQAIESAVERITESEKDITALQQTADGLTLQITRQSGIVQDILNGAGRNLLLKTGKRGCWSYLDDGEVPVRMKASFWNEAETIFFRDSAGGGTYEYFTLELRPEYIVRGKDYTFQVVVDNTSASGPIELFAVIADSDLSGALCHIAYFPQPLAPGENQLSISLKATATGTKDGTQKLILGIVPARVGNWREIGLYNAKLEYGLTATPYSVAPEDEDDYIFEEMDTRITASAGSLTREYTKKIGESEERINEEHRTLIEESTEGIRQEVSVLGESVSVIEQRADSISLKVDELEGVNNLITGNSDGTGWRALTYNGISSQPQPNIDGFELNNSTTAEVSLRTPPFRLERNTKYTLSFKASFLRPQDISLLRVDIFRGSDNAIISSFNLYPASTKTDALGRHVYHLSIGANAIPEAYVIFRHRGNSSASVSTAAYISEVMLETGEVAHRFVETQSGLLATGIDIEKKRITLSADNILFRNNAGETSLFIGSDGKILTRFIRTEELEVDHLVAGDPNGERIEITPKTKSLTIYDAEGNPCTTLNGIPHLDGAEDFYNGDGGPIEPMEENTYGCSLSQGYLHLDAPVSGDLGEKVYQPIYSKPWHSDSASIVAFDHGDIWCKARSTEITNATANDKAYEDIGLSLAQVSVSIVMEVCDNEGFLPDEIREFPILTTGATHNVNMPQYESEGDSQTKATVLPDYNAKASIGGYCRLRMDVTLKARHYGSYAEVRWGRQAVNGTDIQAHWTCEGYLSNHFANGFCLGASKEQYVCAHYNEYGDMNFEARSGDDGFRLTSAGLQIMYNGGQWMNLPKLVCKGRLYYNSAANTYSISHYTSYDGKKPTSASRYTQNGYPRIVLAFPEEWKPLGLSATRALIRIAGNGDTPVTYSVRSITSTSLDFVLNTDSTLFIEIHTL